MGEKEKKPKRKSVKKNIVTDDMLTNLYIKPLKDKGENMPKFQSYVDGYIYQADLLFLPHDDDHKYALVVVDIGSKRVDAMPLKVKESKVIAQGLETIFTRDILHGYPKILEVDAGKEFEGAVSKYLKTKKITLRIAKPYRHRQQAMVERKNQQIGTMLFKRMTAEELLTGEPARGWTDDLPEIIKEINKKIKKRKPRTINMENIPDREWKCEGDACDALEQGTKVRVALDAPIDVATGKRLPGKFRDSDIRWTIKTHTIMQTIIQPGQPPMYLVDKANGEVDHSAAYTRNQLQVVPKNEKLPDKSLIRGTKTKGVTKYIVEKILDKKKEKGKVYYLVKWKGFSNKDNTWEPRTNLIIDVPDMIKEYEKSIPK